MIIDAALTRWLSMYGHVRYVASVKLNCYCYFGVLSPATSTILVGGINSVIYWHNIDYNDIYVQHYGTGKAKFHRSNCVHKLHKYLLDHHLLAWDKEPDVPRYPSLLWCTWPQVLLWVLEFVTTWTLNKQLQKKSHLIHWYRMTITP